MATQSNNNRILIIGGSGNVGRATLCSLWRQGVTKNVFIATRHKDKGAKLSSEFPGLNVIHMDLDQPNTCEQCSEKFNKIFLILPPTENRTENARTIINCVKKNIPELEQLLFFSVPHAETKSSVFTRQFGEAEDFLHQSGLNYTILRGGYFQQNLLGMGQLISSEGRLKLPLEEGRYCPVNVEDIGEVAACILNSDASNYKGKIYTLTGPEMLSGKDVAQILTQVTGRDIQYENVQPQQFGECLKKCNYPEWQVQGTLEMFEAFRQNKIQVSNDFEMLTGHKGRTMKEFLCKYCHQFGGVQHECPKGCKTEEKAEQPIMEEKKKVQETEGLQPGPQLSGTTTGTE